MAGNWTPGPWRVDPDYNGDVQTGDGEVEIAMAFCPRDNGRQFTFTGRGFPKQGEAANNTRLIAAAPDFADAAANIIANALTIPDPRMGGSTDVVAIPFDDFDALQAAYHKARGDQPDSDPPIPNSATPQGA